jgi:hypothetical protein
VILREVRKERVQLVTQMITGTNVIGALIVAAAHVILREVRKERVQLVTQGPM